MLKIQLSIGVLSLLFNAFTCRSKLQRDERREKWSEQKDEMKGRKSWKREERKIEMVTGKSFCSVFRTTYTVFIDILDISVYISNVYDMAGAASCRLMQCDWLNSGANFAIIPTDVWNF